MNKNYSERKISLLSSKPSTAIRLLLIVLFVSTTSLVAFGQSQTFNSSGTFIVPCGVTSITVQVWGGGGGGDRFQRRGGGGGAFSQSTLNVSQGNSFVVTVGQGGAAGTGDNGGDSTFDTLVIARGGNGGNGGSNAGRGGQGSLSTGDITFSGGNGGSSSGNGGAGGGSAAGTINDGANGANNNTGAVATAVLGTNSGGNGGTGGGTNSNGGTGTAPGGGGGERGVFGNNSGGGGNGRIVITYTTTFQSYCTPTFNSRIDPITNVTFAGINKTTSNTVNGTPALESFCDVATVSQGTTYPISVNGNTGVNNVNYITVYIDWNQNGVFDDNSSERYNIGTIQNSDGNDASKALSGNIIVPAAALAGNTRMRVIKSFNNGTNNYVLPCSSNRSGQAEDYTVTVLPACVLPGNTIATVSAVCANTPFTLSLQNTSGSSTAYQWQTSLDNISWSNVTAIPFFNSDFTAIPANTNVYGNAAVAGGELVLTTAVNSQTGGYVIQSTPGTNINSFTTSFDYRMFGGNGADGMSLSYGSDIGNGQGGGEEGEGTGLILKFDSYDNTSNTTASQIRIFYGGIQIFSNTLNSFDLRNALYRNVLLSVDGNGLLSLNIGTTTIVSGLSLPAGYVSSNKSNWKFKFSARTGGLNDKHSIDNLMITYLNSTFTTSQTVPTYYRSIVTCGGTPNTSIPVLVTMDPKFPIVGTITPLTCAIPTGSIVLSDLTVSATLMQTGNVVKTYNITATTMTIDDLTPGDYYFAVKNGTCESVISPVVKIAGLKTTKWDGSVWDNGIPISSNGNNNIIFEANYDSPGNLEGCDCTVNAGVQVNVQPGDTFKITNAVKVNTAEGTSLTFQNTASLVQVNDDVVNKGVISYIRINSTTRETDYTYWSSPVVGQILSAVSPETPSGFFYSFNAAEDNWNYAPPSTVMGVGTGYIIRGPKIVGTPPPTPHEATFKGTPNNGKIELPGIIKDRSYLLGNPYPSALNADRFLTDNSAVLDGTLYFWTHKTEIGIGVSNPGSGVYAYSSDDYATYNLTGGVATNGVPFDKGGVISPSGSSKKPTGEIAAGQAFFTSSRLDPTKLVVVFDNAMRLGLNEAIMDNGQFFKVNNAAKKTNALERNRVWLNLTNTEGAFKQMLVGYLTGATNDYDPSFDGPSYNGNEFIDFYSVTPDELLTIQGRALPFDENDVVPLGYSSAIAGGFLISIDEVDGLLSSQNIYLEDKSNNSIHDLKKGAYSFETVVGTFDDRFALRYTNRTLGVGDFDTAAMQVLVSVKNKQIKINSSVESIDKIFIYDVLGKQVYQKTGVDKNEFTISNLVSTDQVLIVKTVLQNGQIVTTKTVY